MRYLYSSLLVWKIVLLIGIVVAPKRVHGRPSTVPSPPPPTATDDVRWLPPSLEALPFTRQERKEQAMVWRVLHQSCKGCWSGSVSKHGVDPSGGLCVIEPPCRNFRLRAHPQGKKGTWTIWNLMKVGDEYVVPLGPTPSERSAQIKVAFASSRGRGGIVLRIPSAIPSAVPRLFFEVGFWSKTVRRTAVADYSVISSSSRWFGVTPSRSRLCKLDHVWLVQQKRQKKASFRSFVGKTELKDITYLPTNAPFAIDDWDWSTWRAMTSETVDLTTMQRRRTRLDPTAAQEVQGRIRQAFASDSDALVNVLPVEIIVSLPYAFDPTSSPEAISRVFFCHAWDEQRMDVIEVAYRGRQAQTMTMHSFRKR
jgi:hypothetical protein